MKNKTVLLDLVVVFLLVFGLNYFGMINHEYICKFTSSTPQEIGISLSEYQKGAPNFHYLSNTIVNPHNAISAVFFENLGQAPDFIHYYARIPNGIIGFAMSQIIFIFQKETFTITFPGSYEVLPQGEDFLTSYSNYFYGTDTFSHVKHCQEIIYPELYDGIALVYYFTSQGLKYDFIVEPYGRINQIQMSYCGLDGMTVEPTKLTLNIGDSTVYDNQLEAWTETTKEPLSIRFGNTRKEPKSVLTANSPTVIHFMVEQPYDQTQRVVIDPVILTYSTYFGGNGEDYGWNGVLDSSGNIIIVGTTGSSNLSPLDAFQPTYAGGAYDVFIAKFSPDGQSLLYFTFLGGSNDDEGIDVGVDAANNIWVTGFTSSTDFPTMNAYQENNGGGEDAFLTKINVDGQSLLFSTYFGGDGLDRGWRLAVDNSGDVAVAGYTASFNFPTMNAYQASYGGAGEWDIIVFKFSSDGQSLLFSTYFGNDEADWAHGIAVDSSGNIVVAGILVVNTVGRALVLKFSSDGQTLHFQEYISGNSGDIAHGVAVDAMDNIIVTGATSSRNFPTVNASQASYGGGSEDAFVTKLDSDGSIIFSTYLGGVSQDRGYYTAVDSSNNIFITGETISSNFPTADAIQTSFGGGQGDAYVTKFSPDGNLLSSTYIGGNSHDWGTSLLVTNDVTESILLIGGTLSSDFPLVNAYQQCSGGSWDMFLCELTYGSTTEPSIAPSTCIQPTTSVTITNGTSQTTASPGFNIIAVTLGLILFATALIVIKRRKRYYNKN
ncbi:MAG: SBBP repeat-containing protein [Promethearchaeota archaeon]